MKAAMELPKSYIARDHEADIYKLWQDKKTFAPNGTGEPFSILMPPPNANESLHVGHALVITIEDIMTRFARMSGKRALWIPGTDHAGFETQVVYEKKLQKEGKSRFDFTPEQLRLDIHQYVSEQQQHIISQTKLLGASCDWDHLYFTLDDNIVKTTYQTFKKMYDDGLLYRAKRLVNYCTKHGTSFSDLEVTYEERDTELTHIRYALKDHPGEFITTATVRPETLYGDAAIAVSPKDERYAKLVGQMAIVPIINREIPIIADEAVDPEFGTGAVKVTPAHSTVDEKIGARHKLPVFEVINTQGKMCNTVPDEINGMKVLPAREWTVAELAKLDLIAKTEPYHTRIGVCYKCGTVIEPLLLDQWWIKTKPLAEQAIMALRENAITITPKESKKLLIQWLENIIDWNISRQIVWGIPIPAWFNSDDKNNIYISPENEVPEEGNWVKDNDTFDTWFSSTQLPFAALGYPDSEDFKTFFPTSVMETAAEILYFWVGRMIIMSLYATGEVPFKHIYLHGLIVDAEGKKMSKSKGNTVNPLEMMEQFGTDALRWAVIHGTSAGQNFKMTQDRVVGGRNFANKIWNASRFILMQLPEDYTNSDVDPKNIAAKETKDILTKLQKTVSDVTKCLNEDQYGLATDLLFDFFWHQLCDVYLEQAKELAKQPEHAKETQAALLRCLTSSLKLLHPFMPFVTETIWQELVDRKLVKEELLITAIWPS